MQIYRLFRVLMLAVLAVMFAGCASGPPPALPTPTALPPTPVLSISDVLAEPQRWSGQEIIVVALVGGQGADQVLTAGLGNSDPSAVSPEQAIWLAESLPAELQSQAQAGNNIVRVRGRLSPPGAYGRDQQFPYQLSAAQIEVLMPERTTLANLAQNPQALDKVLLTVEGTLLTQQNSALLTDQVSEGGVPTGQNQIKLSRTTIDRALFDKLNSSGEVRWGAVQVVGWWQNATLTPFKITLAQQE
ncbi:MAG: hypothetical protein JOZ51_10800 [Chloroflexi bacterium]|nr:hypothetical protein [Chloroflexota bacterium]